MRGGVGHGWSTTYKELVPGTWQCSKSKLLGPRLGGSPILLAPGNISSLEAPRSRGRHSILVTGDGIPPATLPTSLKQ